MKRIAYGTIVLLLAAAVLASGCTGNQIPGPTSEQVNNSTTSTSVSASANSTASASIVSPTPTPTSVKIATVIHVWAGYMGMPALWLEDPQNYTVAQGSEQQVQYWVDAADGAHPCGAANYYIDNQAAGGAWEITKPQPEYWQGCPSGLAGGAGGLYLYARDTSQLSLGWHTLTIDYLGNYTYEPSQFVAQFLVVAQNAA